jgi:hypothetical protein
MATDIAAVSDILDLGSALRGALRLPGLGAEEVKPMLRVVAPTLRGGPGDQLRQIGTRLLAVRRPLIEDMLPPVTRLFV